MKVLVANLGSTSFKYRLFDLTDETQLARGGIDRIGADAESRCTVEIGEYTHETNRRIPDHAAAVDICLTQLTDAEHGCLKSVDEVAAIGFKAVFAGSLSGVRFVDAALLKKMEQLADIAPAHNPPYAKAMRQLQSAFPEIPLVAALETGFHDTIPDANRSYAVPAEWREKYEIQRWGFHGASHRFIAGRAAEVLGKQSDDGLNVISCHLGGSASVCAIQNGKSIATTMGMSPQSGLPNNNRVGDFDPFALPVLMRATGKDLQTLLKELANESGLLGLSGVSGDVRDLEVAAAEGNERAEYALNVFESAIRSYVGAYMSLLGGTEAIVFTGGIGENSSRIRAAVCENMEWCGLKFDTSLNANVQRDTETRISTDDSRIQVWVIPTNEELVVARQTGEAIRTAT